MVAFTCTIFQKMLAGARLGISTLSASLYPHIFQYSPLQSASDVVCGYFKYFEENLPGEMKISGYFMTHHMFHRKYSPFFALPNADRGYITSKRLLNTHATTQTSSEVSKYPRNHSNLIRSHSDHDFLPPLKSFFQNLP